MKPIIPTAREVIGPAKDALVESRPSAAEHLGRGAWSIPFAGLRGQLAEAGTRLASEVAAARLGSAEDVALRELAASNYDTILPEGQTRSIGEAVLSRKVVHRVGSGSAIVDAADAKDRNSLVALIGAIIVAFQGHRNDVWDEDYNTGSHEIPDPPSIDQAPSNFATIGGTVYYVNYIKLVINRHFANQAVFDGSPIGVHKDADTINVITTADATASNSSLSFSSAPVQEQTKCYVLANAIKRALNAHALLESRPGIIRKGTVFAIEPDRTRTPQVLGGQYVSTQDVYARTGDQTATIPIEATSLGPGKGTPVYLPPNGAEPAIRVQASLFDSAAALPFAPLRLRAAGGGDGPVDDVARTAAKASWTGSYGPTEGALVAGSLRAAGVRRCVVREDVETGTSWVYAADAQWAHSRRWLDTIETILRGTGVDDEWLGWGCKLSMGAIVCKLVRVNLRLRLRSAADLVAGEAIGSKVRDAIKLYLEERADWWRWSLQALGSVAVYADRRILSCLAVSVRDTDGTPIAEPGEAAPGSAYVHWELDSSAVSIELLPPL